MKHPDSTVAGDAAALRELFAAFDRLEDAFAHARAAMSPRRRGYFTPDEDDAVRAMLLTYRNLRLALYDIVGRHRASVGQPAAGEAAAPLRGFVVGYAAALKLYRKSLQLIAVTEDDDFLRAKLNEPDTKFDLEAGFFETVLLAFTSLRNWLAMTSAGWFWLVQRRRAGRFGVDRDAEIGWLLPHIAADRKVLQKLFWRLVWSRLRRDWRSAWQRLFTPLKVARYGSQALMGFALSGLRLPASEPALNGAVLLALKNELRPGDILLVRADDKVTSALLPGFWAHAALYLGSADELRALGGDELPALNRACQLVAQQHSPLGWVIEAIPRGVRLNPLSVCLTADHVAVLRPSLADSELRQALLAALGHLGKHYDFEFDFNVSSRLVCTELVYRCFHGRGDIAFSLVKRLGRWTLTADDLARQVLDALAANPQAALQPVAMWTRSGNAAAQPLAGEQLRQGLLPG